MRSSVVVVFRKEVYLVVIECLSNTKMLKRLYAKMILVIFFIIELVILLFSLSIAVASSLFYYYESFIYLFIY